MKRENKEQKEGPACACGKGDLYDEWLKNEKSKQKKQSDKSSDNK